MQIRVARQDDRDAVWRILQPTIRAGETYALPTDMSEADALAYWMGPDRETFVAEVELSWPHSLKIPVAIPLLVMSLTSLSDLWYCIARASLA